MYAQLVRSRRLARLATTGLLVLAAGLAAPAGTAAATTVPLGTYSATLPIQPFPTVANSADPSNYGFPVTFTNTSPFGYNLTLVQVTVPAGFAVTGTPTVSAAGWSASTSGSTVTASTSSPLGVPSGGSVRLSFNATAPATSATYTFSTAAQGIVASTGVAGDFTNSGADPRVEVHPYANVVTCAPSEICDTGQVGSPSGTQARIVTDTGAIQDVVGLSVDTPTDATCLGLTSPNGRSDQTSFQSIDTTRTLIQTIRVDKSVVNQAPNNGVGSIVVCHNTNNSPSRTTFVDSSGKSVTAGYLPSCSATGLPAGNPCVLHTSKSQAGDFLITVRAPGGDPTDIVGLPAVTRSFSGQ